MKLELTEADMKQLEAFFQEMPTKYGLPLIQFFGKLNEAQNGQQTDVKEVEVEG
jgi:hypothetical protein